MIHLNRVFVAVHVTVFAQALALLSCLSSNVATFSPWVVEGWTQCFLNLDVRTNSPEFVKIVPWAPLEEILVQ